MTRELHGSDAFQPEGAYQKLTPERRMLLTRELARQARQAQRPSAIPRLARVAGQSLPCSFAQERLWFLDQMDPGSAAYVMPGAVRFTGSLDVDVLRDCLSEVVRRHETLRTNVVPRDGEPWQVVRPAAALPLPVTNLDHLPGEAAWATVSERCREEARRPFDLAHDRLIRAALLRLRDDEHVLLVSMHHIVADGWSLGVLQREMATLYPAFLLGAGSSLPELPIQYADFAAWQRDRMDHGEWDAQLGHWRRRLAGAPVLELPADRPRGARRSSRGDSVPLRLDADTVRAIDRFAEADQATPFMVLLAGLTVLLWRWSGQDDLVVGAPIANRGRAEFEPLVGFFANTLPLRFDLSGDPSFRDLVRAVREECLAAYANQDIPFERIVRELGVDRSAGPVPLVQVMLALRNVPTPELRLPRLTIRQLDVASRSTKFDLSLDLVPEPDGGIGGRAEFSTDLFEADTVRRMVQAFHLLLAAGLAEPATSVSRLSILSPADSARMARELSGGGSAAPARTAGTLHGLFERRVDSAPDAPAVVCGDRTLTYRELDERANQLAWLLRAHGVLPEHLVGVALPRSEEMVVAVLGVLKAGAGYVPLDPAYPRRRVAYMAADARVRVVLTHSSVAEAERYRVQDAGPAPWLVCLDTEASRTAEFSASRPPAVVTEANLAYVIYTSGSTGWPKGSANEHGRVANTMHGVNQAYRLGPADRMLAISSLNYDMSVYELFGTLAAGATVVVPDDIVTTDPRELQDLLCRQGVTAWSSAPALLDMLVSHAYQRGGLPGVALRVVGLGGDRMPPALPARLAELVPGVRLLNLAGMTEVSYCSTFHPVATDRGGGILWGRPLPNHRLYVLDRHGEPVPMGVPGELHIGGAGPGRGYWRSPGLTADRFRPDPFSPEPGGRMYATGDHARFLRGGDLEFLGRLDHQVKIRGFRIELGDIEAALARHPGVNEPLVVSYQDAAGERRLAAYVTPRSDRPTATELRRFLGEHLPGHMVPTAYVVLDRLPLLPSGKLDRAALPAPTVGRPVGDHPPMDPLERVLADLWADLLTVDRVGVEEDFFDLGGHSLLATRAVSRIRDLFRVGLGIPGFLAAGTVHGLAAHLRELGPADGVDVDLVAALILQVTALSAEEARARLAE